MISRSYWPSTRVDIHPSSTPISTPAARRVNAPGTARQPLRSSNRSASFWVNGRSSRSKLARLALIQPSRPTTLARAGPPAERSPVAWATSSSASVVSSAKSDDNRS